MTIINDFVKTLAENPYIILLAVILTCVTVYVVMKGKKGIYEAALYLVTVAEEEWGSKTGQIKFAEVISTIKAQHPIFSMILKEETLKKIIEDALAEMKRILAAKEAEEAIKTNQIPSELEKVELEADKRPE